MQKVREKKEWYESNVERLVTRCGVPALIITVLEGVTLAPAVVAIGVLAFAHSVTLKADLLNMEQAQAKWEQEIHELEEPRAHLEAALAQLSEDSKLIDGVAHIVERSINRVTDLQRLDRTFMRFLLDMNKIISNTVKRSKRVYSGFKRWDSFVDPGI
ncbi:uncharacterized protein N7487_007412 [Penicillium crustosum]|uniref:uncharacterized protein n=1 Tax=Penicillium crustosum TaxID=36656 RepID=UPI00239DDE14|nr:uncharacterized protein N7487_007412 [Penicillium crustosum]KAJ5401516.1 hypothetical protein N7487_007412 [Penicillium crustosum]